MLDLTWDYPVEGPLPSRGRGGARRDQRPDAERQPLSSYTELKDDGSTACGCWIYCGVYADGVNQAARRKPGREQSWVAPEWGWAWPATGGSCTTAPRPTRTAGRGASARPRLVGRGRGQVDRA